MPGLQDAFERIGGALERHLTVSHAAGAALAVTDHEEILGVVVRGVADAAAATPVRPETRFQIGSISKSFAAAVALQEAEAGRLDLHASVNELLPWLELPESLGPITTHHLLTHSGGLVTGTEDAPTGLGAASALRHLPPTFPPGDQFWYSNDGYKLVGLILERIVGTSIQDLLHRRMLGPLGMASSVAAITDGVRADLATGYEPMYADRPPQLAHPLVPATWITSNTADGSIVSNVIDMSAYARFLLNRGDGPNGRALSEAAFGELTRRRIGVPGDPHDYAYGLQVEKPGGSRFVGHTGGMVGYTALLAIRPDDGLGCVMLQNGSGDRRGVVDDALEVIGRCLRGSPTPEPWFPREADVHPDAGAFEGRYEGDRRTLRVEAVHGRVRLAVGPVGVTLTQDPLSDPGDVFLLPHPSLERFPLRFARDAEGRVVEAFHGDEWFRGDRWTGAQPERHPLEWEAYPGLYRSNDPWARAVRIVLRKGRLALQWPWEPEEEPELTPLPDGSFAVGETWTPRRIRFERAIDGKTAVAVYNGGRWYRSFEP